MPTEAELEAMARMVHPMSRDAEVYINLKTVEREAIMRLMIQLKMNEALVNIRQEIGMIDIVSR